MRRRPHERLDELETALLLIVHQQARQVRMLVWAVAFLILGFLLIYVIG